MKKVLSLALSLGVIMALSGPVAAKNFRLAIGAGHPAEAAIWITTMRDFFAAGG